MWEHLLTGLHDLCSECQLMQMTRCLEIHLAWAAEIVWLFNPSKSGLNVTNKLRHNEDSVYWDVMLDILPFQTSRCQAICRHIVDID